MPAFIVTLGGLLVWRGAAWWVTMGRTVAPMDPTFQLMGGGPAGSIGATWSWVVGVVACVAIVVVLYLRPPPAQALQFSAAPDLGRRLARRHRLRRDPRRRLVANAYPWPIRIAENYAEANGITMPEGGLFISHGIAIPVLIALGVGVVMTFVATRTRFGRYVFAMGGNPEAAELAGINTRWVTVKIFMLMGVLVRHRRGDLLRPPQRRDQRAGHARRALRHRRGGHRRHVAGRRRRHHRRRHARRAGHAVAAVGHGAARRRQRRCSRIVVGVVLVFAVWLDTLYRRRVK